MKKPIEQILKGIEVYADQQREIVEAIRKHGGRLHQDDFDKEFADVVYKQQNGATVCEYKRLKMWPISKDSCILGSMTQPGDWARYLCLAQLMLAARLLRTEGEPPNLVYMENTCRHRPSEPKANVGSVS